MPKLKIIKSKIAGNGVITKEPIKKGEKVHIMNGEIIDIHEMIRRVDEGLENGPDPLGIERETYLDLDELSRSINHSCNPNSFLNGKRELIAIRDIGVDEEITFDYSTTMDDNEEIIGKGNLWTCKCKCKSENCRKIINQFKTLPEEVQQFYIKYQYLPDFILKKFK